MPEITSNYKGKNYTAFYNKPDMDNSEIEAYSIEINDKSWKDEVAPYSIT